MSEINEKGYGRVRERMQTYNRPPMTPTEEMWPRIRASWQDQADQRKVVTIRRKWARRGLAAAALIVLGVSVGRMSVAPAGGAGQAAVSVAEVESGISATYRIAASRHFDQSETLLLLFGNDPAVDDFVPLVRNLLTTTRLLLDSRAADDPRIRELLLDLELVFSQLVHLEPGNDVIEREMITESVEGGTLLPRLRSLIPTPRA